MKPFIKKRQMLDIPTQPQLTENRVIQRFVIPINDTNMFRNFKFSWEGMFFSLLWTFCLLAIVMLGMFALSKKYTHQYTLGGDSRGTLKITKEIDWSADEGITLDRSVTYSEAIRMVDSLNKTLHNGVK